MVLRPCTLFASFGFAALLVLWGCDAGDHSRPLIIGGELVKSGVDHRAGLSTVVLRKVSFPHATVCSGTLIGPRHIATAAHCLTTGSPLEATLDGGLPMEIKTVLKHPRFKMSQGRVEADIGIVVLVADAANDAKPVKLATAGNLKAGDAILLAGFGRHEPVSRDEGLRQVRVQVDNFDEDALEFSIVAGTKKGVCAGDSGGPAYSDDGRQLRMEGITSRLPLNGDCFWGQGVFTNITRYQGWLKCAFASAGEELVDLKEDASAADCRLQ